MRIRGFLTVTVLAMLVALGATGSNAGDGMLTAYVVHGIDGDDTIGGSDEMAGPETRAARELENAACGPRLAEGLLHLRDFREPGTPVSLASVVPPSAQEPLVVLGGASTVVLDLLGQEIVVLGFHTAAKSTERMVTANPPSLLERSAR